MNEAAARVAEEMLGGALYDLSVFQFAIVPLRSFAELVAETHPEPCTVSEAHVQDGVQYYRVEEVAA